MSKFPYLVCLLLFPIVTLAQSVPDSNELNTDRPDQTDAPYTLRPGEIQLEEGLLYNHFKDGTNAFINKFLIRAGIWKGLELRASIEDGWQRDKYIEESAQSSYPLYIGAKLRLVEGHHWIPDMSIISYVEIPATARESKQKGHWAPTILWAVEKKPTDKLLISYNIGIGKEAYSNEYKWAATFVVHYEIMDKTDVFAEYFANYGRHNEPDHNADAGILYSLTRNSQLDLSFGANVSDIRHDRFASLGYTIRFPR